MHFPTPAITNRSKASGPAPLRLLLKLFAPAARVAGFATLAVAGLCLRAAVSSPLAQTRCVL